MATTKFWLVASVLTYLISACDAINTALIIVDVQNCFLPGGSLAVADGEKVIPVINDIRDKYSDKMAVIVLTQDWHCPDHVSFAAEHSGKDPYEEIVLQYDETGNLCNQSTCDVVYNVTQMLWPVHCVINTTSAQFSTALKTVASDILVQKGYTCDVDSYSGFFDNGGFSKTRLDEMLKARGISRVIITGLALDYCVYYTSKDAVNLGYETYVVEDASRPVAESTAQLALSDMKNRGVHIIQSRDLGTLFSTSSAAFKDISTATTVFFYVLFLLF